MEHGTVFGLNFGYIIHNRIEQRCFISVACVIGGILTKPPKGPILTFLPSAIMPLTHVQSVILYLHMIIVRCKSI